MNLNAITVTEISDVLSVLSPKGRHHEMYNRRSYALSLCIDGQITYIQDGKSYISNRDVAVILPKGGRYTIHGDKTGEFPVINFDCAEFLCDTVTVIPVREGEELLADYEKMKRIFGFEENRAQLFSIFYGILHRLGTDRIPYELRAAVRYIRSNYGDSELTNARLAAECKISEVYFRKLFVKHFKISPKQYVIELRVQKAKQMLTEGVATVAAVSEQCGFTNPYHFSRIFKQHTGSTPSEYRRNHPIRSL